ncbi:MAG: molybdopterin molybdenumtransferase MoeA [Desulfurivibrio sp.]|nr:MAG: molybdopterin molybdenumtransferase MoeA [Desulfurivibrio sp.]
MSPGVTEPLSLAAARKLITGHACPLPGETLPLQDCLHRRPARNLLSAIPVPHFCQSTMDGYAINGGSMAGSKPPLELPVVGEIAAGCTEIVALAGGEAVRIMTGGSVPAGADRVIPFEWCREADGLVIIFRLGSKGSHIRQVGTDLRKGQLIIRQGEVIFPCHLHLLATSGMARIRVFARPSVLFVCTGSELVEKSPLPGQIISGNRALLHGLITEAGGNPGYLGAALDDTDQIAMKLQEAGQASIIITTGGMGPGKYDLMGEVLEKIGVQILYRSLQVRPGRATIFGVREQTMFFSLPGPPPAVQILFNELVRPAIFALQGKRGGPAKVRAILDQDIVSRKKGVLNLKNGITSVRSGLFCVRPAGLTEPSTATILIPGNRRLIRAGEKVTVHLH